MKTKIQFHSARLLALALTLALGAKCAWAADYYWIGGGTQTEGAYAWNDSANWSMESSSGSAATDFPGYDAWSDTVHIDVDVSVKLNSFKNNNNVTEAPHIGSLSLGSGKTLTLTKGTTGDLYLSEDTEGGGTLVLNDGINIRNRNGKTISINANIEMGDGAAVSFTCDTANASRIQFNGSISGSEKTTITLSSSKKYGGFHVVGNCSGFYGVMDWKITGESSAMRIFNTANLEHARVYINKDTHDNTASSYLFARSTSGRADSEVHKYGALDANFGTINRNGNGQQAYSVQLQLGNDTDDSRLTGTFVGHGQGSSDYAASITWIGAKTLTLDTGNLVSLNIVNEGYVSATAKAVPSSALNFNEKGGYLILTDSDVAASLISKISTIGADAVVGFSNAAALELDLSTKAAVLNTHNIGKKGAGDLTLTGLSGTYGDLTVDGGKLTIPAGLTVGAITLTKGGSIAVDADLAPGASPFLTATGDCSDVAITVHGFSVTGQYDGETYTTWSVDAYHWIGGGTDNNWTTPANWGLSSGASVPGSGSTAVFDSAAEVTLTANQAVSSLMLNADLTLSGSGEYGLTSLTAITGAGSLILDNSGIENNSSATLSFNNQVVIQGMSKNWLKGNGAGNSTSRYLQVRGPLSGAGYVELQQGGVYASGVQLFGDNHNFSGTAKIIVRSLGNHLRHTTVFNSAVSGSSAATWIVDTSSGVEDGSSNLVLLGKDETISFGRLSGKMRFRIGSYEAINIEIGAAGGVDATDEVELYLTGASLAAYRELPSTVIKKGLGTLVVRGENNSWPCCVKTYVVESGTLQFAGRYSLLDHSNSSDVRYSSIKFNGGTVTYDNTLIYPLPLDISSRIVAGEAAVSIAIPAGVSSQWATALTDVNAPHGLVKSGAGTLHLTAIPTYTGTTTVKAGTLIVPGNTTIARLSVEEGATFMVAAQNGETITITEFAEGTTTSNISVPAGSSLEWVDNTATVTRANPVWTDAQNDHKWTTPGNWSVNGQGQTILPLAGDTVEFPEGTWNVEVDTATVKEVKIDGNVTFTGTTKFMYDSNGSGSLIYTTSVKGNGTVTLGDNAGFGCKTAGGALTVGVPVVITAASDKPAAFGGFWKKSGDTTENSTIKMEKAITGSGTFVISGNRLSGTFSGDMTKFSGNVTVIGDGLERNDTRFATISANACYCITNSNQSTFLSTTESSYDFGELSGNPTILWYNLTGARTFNVGSRDTTFALAGKYHYTLSGHPEYLDTLFTGGVKINKVGSGVMTFTGSHVYAYDITEGELKFDSDNALYTPASAFKDKNEDFYPSITFKGGVMSIGSNVTVGRDPSAQIVGSTAPISFSNAVNEVHTWAKELAASNEKGLVKIGEGTLILEKKPLYTADTVLNGGTLKIPTTADVVVKTTAADSKVVTSSETIKEVEYTVYTLQTLTDEEKPTADENGVIQIPASMSGQSAAYALDAGQSLDCSLLTDASGIKAVVTTTVDSATVDITSCYTAESLAVVNGKIEPQLANSVQVGFADGESTEAAVVTVEEGSVKSTFTLPGTNVKKGLYYSVGTVTNPAAADSTTTDFSVLAEKQATADNQAISLDAGTLNFGTGNVLYYKWSVSDTPQVATP